MRRLAGAILAALALAGAQQPEPLRVRFRLADGVWVAGDMTAWDGEGIDGSFGRRLWSELLAEDVWKLHALVIDRGDASQWIGAGRALLGVEGGAPWADRAFRRALAIDPGAGDRIEAARRDAAEAQRRRDEARRAHRLETRSPEAAAWPADPWPALSDEERAEAVAAMKADAEAILRRAGLPLEPLETPRFLLYSDLERVEAARWALRLDAVEAALGRLLGVGESHTVFFGKAAVFIFAEQDRFRLVEAESFDQLVRLERVGICHPVGPKVFVNLHRVSDADAFADALTRETVHGFMHRYQTPRRLPPWANEGLAAHVSGLVDGESPVVLARRRLGLEYVRRGGDVQAVLGWTYEEGGWPGPGAAGEGVAALLVELMVAQRPVEFVAWVGAVKSGKDWEAALREDYGVPRERLIETFIAYYRVND